MDNLFIGGSLVNLLILRITIPAPIMSLASRDNTPSRGVIPQTSSTTVGEYYYKLRRGVCANGVYMINFPSCLEKVGGS